MRQWSQERLGPGQVSEGPGTSSVGGDCPPPTVPQPPTPLPQYLLTSLAVLPGEALGTEAVWAPQPVHTGPSPLAGVVLAAGI